MDDHFPPKEITRIDLVFEAMALLAGAREAERSIRRSASRDNSRDDDRDDLVLPKKV